jgi:hypothetical protein
VGNGCGTFVVTRGFGAPGSKGFVGRGWRLRPTLPGAALHQHWASEQEAAAAPSMEWALWVLDCFLETCAPWELTAGGILAGRTYEALVRCIVDAPACTDRTRVPAASLLTRLLRTRRALLLGGMPPTDAGGLPLLSRRALAELPASVRALGRVNPDLLRLCRARVQAQGRLFLPRDLQQVVELVTTVNWGLPRAMALLRPLAPTTTATAVAAMSLLRRAARGDRPTDAEALVDLMALVEFFGSAAACTEQGLGLGQHAASPPLPPPFCATTLRAWLEARGCAAVVESAHPLRLPAEEDDGDEKAAAEAFGGEVALDGAETVEVVFDGRSALPAGVTLLLTGGNPNPGAPPVDWEAGTGLITWRGGCAGGGADFATRLLFRGPRLRWRLEKGPVSAAAVGSGAKRKRAAKGVGGGGAGGEAGRDAEEEDLLASLSQAIDQLALRPDDKPASTLPTAPISVGGGIGGGAAAAIHDSEGGAEVWGVGFTVLAKRLPPAARLRQLQGAVEERALVDAFPCGGAWSVEHDAAIGALRVVRWCAVIVA